MQAKTLYSGLIGQNAAAVYNCQPKTSVVVSHAVFTNTDNSTHTLTVYVVPLGKGTTAETVVLQAKSLTAGQSYVSGELLGVSLENGDSICIGASVGSKIAAYISGFVFT